MSTSSGGINLASLLHASQLVTDGHHVRGSEAVTGSNEPEEDSKMAGETESESTIAELSMEDLMDVVTTYKCKFCQFTANQPKAISDHIRISHIDLIQVGKKKKETVQAQEEQQQQKVAVTKPDESEQQSEVVITEDQLKQVLRVSEGTQVIVQDGEQITLVTEAQEAQDIVEQAYHVSTTMTEEDGGTAMLVTASDVKSHIEEPERDDMIVSETQTEGEADGEAVSGTVPGAQLVSAEEQGAEDESQMFVCGQCNLAFTSIEECKQHMVKDHNITMESMECLDAEMNNEIHDAPNKVSVATQVVPAKRPGRKPKRLEPVTVIISDEEIEDEDDEEESENVQLRRNEGETTEVGFGKGKRRIRPPRAMTDIYYMGKKKQPIIKKRRLDRLEGYDLSCSVAGCAAKFKTAESLLLHQRCHVDAKERKMLKNKTKDGQAAVFTCPICPQGFKLWKQVRTHLWKEHQVDTDLLTCDKCDFKSESFLKMETHQETHNEDRTHICQICNKGFKQASQLKNHRVNVHKQTEIKADAIFSCHICKREFATAKYLNNHLQQVHATVKQFQCTYCSHTTARKAMMELHIRTHTGEKPYKCNLCNYATGDHNSLRRHKMRHSGRKPYKCQHCPYSCIQAISLKTHMKNKHPGCSEGIYMCDQCQYRTVNKQNYDNHVEDHKNGLVSLGTEGEEDQTGGSSRRRITTAKTVKGKHQVLSTVDLSKVPGMEGLEPGDMNTAQLIYAALSATSQQQHGDTSQVEAGVQQASTVTSTTHDGVTTHTITLHLPQLSTGAQSEMPPGASQEGTSSAAVDVSNPVVLAVNQGNPQAVNLFTNSTAEPSAAAGEIVHLATDGNNQQQVTDIVQAIQGLEVLHQGGDTGQAHILQAPQQAQVIQGLEVLNSSQLLQALGGLQSFEGIQVIQPQIGNTISVDGQTLQIQGHNIIAADTGQVLFKTEEGETTEAQKNTSEQS